MIAPDRFAISLVGSKYDNHPRRAVVTWPELVGRLTKPRITDCTIATCGTGIDAELDKDGKVIGCRRKNGPSWIPATFSTGRKKTTVEEVSLLVVDADHLADDTALDGVLDKLARYSYVGHATHSDHTGDRCARIAIPLSRPVPGQDWPRFWPAAMAALGMPADPACSDAGRLYYLPACPTDAEFWFAVHDGEPLDVAAIIASAPTVAPTVAASLDVDESGSVGEGQRHAMLKSLAGSIRHRGAGLVEIEAALLLANQHRCKPPKAERVVKEIAAWAAAQPVSSIPPRSDRTPRRPTRDRDDEPAAPPADSAPAADDIPPPADEAPPPDDDDDDDDDDDHPNAPGAPGPGPRKVSQATLLVGIARQRAELWRSSDGDLFASVDIDDHREHLRLASKPFRQWLAHLALTMMGRAASAGVIRDATSALEGIARYDGPEHVVHTRIAAVDDRIYIDLCDERWRVVEIDRDGWRVVARPPVRFERRPAMAALPAPVPGGRLDELREHVRISDSSWPLVLGWLVGALAPRGPYPVLVLRAVHGAGKSSAARRFRSLIDPSIAPIRCEPREPRDLVISARASHVIALDNISSIPPWLSDGLCRLATGGGYAARALYTDADEIVIDVKRPVILTGIVDIVTAPDLLDRCLLVELGAIAPEDRKTERQLDARWDAAWPRILGALYTAVSTALARRDEIQLKLPRLADWATWATAAEPALGLQGGAVIAALDGQAEEAVEIALDASIIARPICEWIDTETDKTWTGTAAALLIRLTNRVEAATAREKAWPSTPRAMAGALARIAPALRERGVCAERRARAHGGARPWTIARLHEVKL